MPRLDEATRQRIINLAFAGLSRRAIVREVGCCKAAVDRAVRVYRDECSIGDAPRSGRPPATSLQDDILIIAAVNCDPSLSLSKIHQELGLQVSRHTIRRRLNAAGLRSRVACQRLLLNEREKRANLDFTREHVQWGNTEWSAVIFSDESTFVTRWDQRQRVWRLVGSRYDPHYIQQVAASGRCVVSVWGALSQQGLGPLHRIDGTLTADKYQDIIEQVLIPYTLDGPFPDGCFLFQHDRSPIHTARYVNSCFRPALTL
ncbi:hypothetical protein V5799_022868 [Amblyomma americanum]|uniref:Transposable element n=1 Tax=Amblyomma americanum TaxID=6943 RepID=A0AAQ4FJV6_AMBAM